MVSTVRYRAAPPMKRTLLDLIVCPHDAEPLSADGAAAGSAELPEAELTCARGHRFAVRDGVARLTPSEAGRLGDQAGTFDTFSAKWSRVDREEVRQRVEAQYRWYVERFGFGDEDGLREFLADKRMVLEAGTGLGGDAARFARLSDATVVALDLSESIVTAQREFGAAPNLHYIQADLLRPPLPAGRFDFVSADQVVHHTPDAAAAVRSLAQLLAPGGVLAFYVYKRKAPLREHADDYLRERTTRMSVEECMEFSASMSELGRELSRLGATITLERGIPLLGIEPGEHDVQRLVYWHFLKCFWNDGFSPNLNDLVNFDWYHPPYASRHTEAEVRDWCEQLGLTIDHLDVADAGISVRAALDSGGRRPRGR
jgi:SAM-dependent methyltransferase